MLYYKFKIISADNPSRAIFRHCSARSLNEAWKIFLKRHPQYSRNEITMIGIIDWDNF